ncbi:MAG: copper-binding protein [Candidatus Sulfotelmatobacter sp.]
MAGQSNSRVTHPAVFCLCALLTFAAACNRGTPQPGTTNPDSKAKRYALKGTVISLDKQAGTANINNEPIKGFMDPMVMPYAIKPPSALDQVQPSDSITADVVVEPDKYWLENVKVVGHSQTSAGKSAMASEKNKNKEK